MAWYGMVYGKNTRLRNEMAPLIGEFLMRFNSVQAQIELWIIHLEDPWDWRKGTKVISKLGLRFDKELNTYKEHIILAIEQHPSLSKRSKSKARAEFNRIVRKLENLNEVRNVLAHAVWDYWNSKHSTAAKVIRWKDKKSLRKQEKPMKYYRIEAKFIRSQILDCKSLRKEIWDWYEKWGFYGIQDSIFI